MSFTRCLPLCFLTLSLSVNSQVILHALPSSIPTTGISTIQNINDELAIRILAETFFKRWAEKDLDGLMALWSKQSPELEAQKKASSELFAGSESIKLNRLTIRRIKVEGVKARALVESDAQVIESKSGDARKGYGKRFRTLECVKEDGDWRVWREISTYDELAAALTAAANDQDRDQLLGEEKELATSDLALALINQGNSLYSKGDFRTAMTIDLLALNIAEKIGARPEIARALHNLGNVNMAQSDLALALERYQRSMAIYDELGERAGVASILNNIGSILRQQGDYAQALDYFQKSIAIRESLGNKPGAAAALNNIGIVNDSIGNHAQALDYYQQSLKLCESINDKVGISRALNNLGLAEHHMGNNAKALDYFLKSMVIGEELGDKAGIPNRLINIGLVYSAQGSYEQALEYFRKGLATFESVGDRSGISKALNSIGSIHFKRGEYAQALEYYQKTLALKESLKDKSGIASATFNIGIVYDRRGDYPQALERFQKSLELNETIGSKSGIAISLKSIANVYSSQGNYARSLVFAERAVTVARSIGESETLLDALTASHRAYRNLNKPVEARKSLEEAIAITEALRDQVAGGEEQQQRFFQSKVSPYYAMVEFLARENKPAEALSFAERAKARVLLDVLQEGRASSALTMTVPEQEQERRLRAELISINTQVTRLSQRDKPDQVRLGELNGLREKARLKYEAFQSALYAAHPELKVRRGEAPVIKAEELAALLPNERSALIEYVVTENSTYLFTAGKAAGKAVAEVRAFILPVKQSDLETRIDRFRDQLADRDLGFRASSAELYRMILKPALAQLRGKTNLIIAPDDKLWELPFQALLAEDDHYLIEKSAVSYAPSLTVLREMNAQREKRGSDASSSTLLAFGNPAFGRETIEHATLTLRDGKLDPLPEAEQEVKELGRLYGAAKSRIYVGAEAREDRAKTEGAQAGILHFATHGILNNSSPMYSYLALAQGDKNEDGLLEAWELMRLDLHANLVVLSACETARGRFGAGEGMIGLTWAMFIAGAPSTLVSQWKVESASTRDLMLNFHRQLLAPSGIAKSRATKSEALRQAALTLMKNPATSHPFYWAGFVLVGDPR